MIKRYILPAIFIAVSAFLYADITFSLPDLNPSGELLFNASVLLPGGSVSDTLFVRSIEKGPVRQLTCYPEKMEVLDGGRFLQVRSRFGTARYNTETAVLSWVQPYRGFDEGLPLPRGRMDSLSVSPDGRWYVKVQKSVSSAVTGNLVLFDVLHNRETVIAAGVDRNPDSVPVSWSPDSATLIYAYGGNIYFAHPETFFTASRLEDRYRKIGQGTIGNISWASNSQLIYVWKNEVYAVPVSELFTRSLYSDLIGAGVLRGKLPFIFNSASDTFTAGNDGKSLIVIKDKRTVSYIELRGDDYAFSIGAASLPYLTLPGSTLSVQVIWPEQQLPIIWVEGIEQGKTAVQVWKLENRTLSASLPGFVPLSVPAGAGNLQVSSDKKLAAFSAAGFLYVYNTSSWTQTAVFRDENVVSCVWDGPSQLYIGGAETIRSWIPGKGQPVVLFLSGVSGFGWNEQADSIVADTKSSGRFVYDSAKNSWVPSPGTLIRNPLTVNADWRIYLDDSENDYYRNAIYVRSSAPLGKTVSLLKEPSAAAAAVPVPSQETDSSVFSHGLRSGKKQIALTFDALDNADGLPVILKVLSDYNIKATFFINGEFIRRHPSAVRDIAEAGHQSGSLFFTAYDLSSPSFRIDEDFILKGLARNEDDFYAATGKELSLFWHTPYYMVNAFILDAGKSAGYIFTGSDVFPADWVTLESALTAPGMYKSAAALTDEILAKVKNGSIVPIGVGKPDGTRADYLYDKLAILIDALIEEGYGIVPVSVLAAAAK